MFDWEAWRAQTGGADGHPDPADGADSTGGADPAGGPGSAGGLEPPDRPNSGDRAAAGDRPRPDGPPRSPGRAEDPRVGQKAVGQDPARPERTGQDPTGQDPARQDPFGSEAAVAADGRWSGRTGVAVLAVAAVCALLGGFAAFAATLGGPAPSAGAALSIPPGHVAGTLAPGGAGVGPDHGSSGGPSPSLSPVPRPTPSPSPTPEPSLSPLPLPTGLPTIGEPGIGQPPIGQPATGQPATGTTPGNNAAPGDPFSAAVTSYLASRAGTVLAAIYDINTGKTWTLGSGPPQATGSLVKIDILQTLLNKRPHGISAADQARARSMIENNVNAPATVLWNQIGRAAGLSSYNALVGLAHTTPSTCLVCAGFGWPGWGLTTTTPADQLLLLRQLVDGSLLSPAARSYVVSLMENVQPDQRWGVSAGVPPGVQVALKNAWVPLTPPNTDWQINSEGWITGDGRNYLIAVLTTGNPDEQYGIDTINTLSALLWPAIFQARGS